ncbi:MAG: (d)CMP kinase [Pelolinea sp.]|jgi:cytidylate kinase|nr:(d)CMP kinase [Pelolinea sp.]
MSPVSRCGSNHEDLGRILKLKDAITIDGPVASGKSTVGKQLAEKLGYQFLDTGIMYRAATLAALEQQIDLNDENAVSERAEQLKIDILSPTKADGRQNDVFVDGVDVTGKLWEDDVRDAVSLVSSYKRVRQAMTEQQRRIGAKGKIVMVGRDIGTVVLPDAKHKFFLVASVDERARRRYLEIKASGKAADLDEIKHALKERDRKDSSRKLAPLIAAKDARTINTDGKNVQQVVDEIVAIIRES